MENPELGERKTRLQPLESDPAIRPFSRANQLHDLSLYWIPVTGYPIPFQQRRWLLEFLIRLKKLLAGNAGLRVENFLQLKYLQQGLHDRFNKTLMEYHPTTSIAIAPGAGLPRTPTSGEIKEMVDANTPGHNLNLDHLTADYCCWFVQKQDERQRTDFFGVGGMFLFFLAPDPATEPPKFELPRFLKTHPAFKNQDIDEPLKVAFALKDSFLAKSKEVFGSHLKEEAVYPSLPFIAPLLRSEDFFRATPEERGKWFDVFHGYCIESVRDAGVLLAMKEPQFDKNLAEILKEMRDEGMEYPR